VPLRVAQQMDTLVLDMPVVSDSKKVKNFNNLKKGAHKWTNDFT